MNYKSLFPLSKGNWWSYKIDDANVIVSVSEVTQFMQYPLFILSTLYNEEEVQKENYVYREDGLYLYVRTFPNGNIALLDPPLPVLSLDNEVGISWDWTGNFSTMTMNFQFSIEKKENIEVIAGNFDAYKVKIIQNTGQQQIVHYKWYASGIGIIKEVSMDPQLGFTAILEEFQVEQSL